MRAWDEANNEKKENAMMILNRNSCQTICSDLCVDYYKHEQ